MERQGLEKILQRFSEIENSLGKPEIVSDQKKYKQLAKEYSDLKPLADAARDYLRLVDEIHSAQEMLAETDDPEMREYLQEELENYRSQLEKLDEELKRLLLPQDPDDRKNAIVEIRAGTGGEEAALFARDLFKMYVRYAEDRGWKVSVTELHETELGGYKEVVFLVEGDGAYGRLKYESGVHRVQRIPVTESGGRIHTSTASVVVLPESEEVDDVDINLDELKIETFRAGGPGGQHVNMTDSAVRITHLPTGIVVTCQDERSQHKNRAKAMRILKARLLDMQKKQRERELGQLRRSYIGTGDRSEKIRTYNFPQNRVTDHRIGLTIYNLESVLEGNLDLVIAPLLQEEERRKLEELEKAEK